MAKKLDRRIAVAGERFIFLIPAGRGPEVFTIQPKPESATNNGAWHCISCDQRLRNNLEKDFHCHTTRRGNNRLVEELGVPAKHVLAWYSAESGEYEVP